MLLLSTMPKRGVEEHGGEAKGGEGDLLAKAIKHCWGNGFLDVFRAYFRKHAHKFEVPFFADSRSTIPQCHSEYNTAVSSRLCSQLL